MKLNDFFKLSVDEQVETVSKGDFLGEREAKPYLIFLFNIENFYAEIFYDELKNKITRVKPFKAVRILEPYLEKVNIEKLF
ncbi:MAG: hypothetical protein H7Y13_16365 [Sphingobacteriaceae bacterium]|nr:hypothetical protein [Sphingobacteriaceae bacterium]